jgi:aspartate-semialdehyde dehydrogenase
MTYKVAVIGASGVVGREMVRVLEQRNFPISELTLLASKRSAGARITFKGNPIEIKELEHYDFLQTDFALFSAGSEISAKYVKLAEQAGCVVIDNSSYFRMHTDVPLIVPEVNGSTLKKFRGGGIISNPNCAAIQLAVVLKPLHEVVKIKRVVVSTYQSVSGAGAAAMEELKLQTLAILNNNKATPEIFKKQISFNLLPQIDIYNEDGQTQEEQKIIQEIKKIVDPQISITATCVRVPVFNGHSESVNIEFAQTMAVNEALNVLKEAPGVEVWEEQASRGYITPLECEGQDAVFVSRIRRDNSAENALNMWIVSDNLRKGAALNAVQIAEQVIKYANNSDNDDIMERSSFSKYSAG